MTPEYVIGLGRNALEMALMLAGPMLAFGLAAGLLVSVFQAMTQIQELTLTFIPKILAVVLAILLFSPWMLQLLSDYTRGLIVGIPGTIR